MPEVPAVPAGTRLSLPVEDWRYGRGQDANQPFTLVVAEVRTDLAHHYGNEWVWITGHGSGCVGGHPPCCEALVRTTALSHREEALSAAR
jgi:hypothetical protein